MVKRYPEAAFGFDYRCPLKSSFQSGLIFVPAPPPRSLFSVPPMPSTMPSTPPLPEEEGAAVVPVDFVAPP
jgi:hypothetical protein